MSNVTSFHLPSLESLTTLSGEAQMRKIRGYLYQLTEQLKFILGNLETENFTASTARKIENAADQDETAQAIAATQDKSQANFRTALAQIIASAESVTANYSAELTELSDRIQSQVRADYALKDDVSQSLASLTSTVTQNATDITATFTRVAHLEQAVGGFSDERFSAYIRFDADGMELGRADSDFRCRLSNRRLSFLQGANEVAYVSDNRLYILDAAVTGTLTIGHGGVGCYDFQREVNGSLSLVFRAAEDTSQEA